jgi:hypothetical protein
MTPSEATATTIANLKRTEDKLYFVIHENELLTKELAELKRLKTWLCEVHPDTHTAYRVAKKLER